MWRVGGRKNGEMPAGESQLEENEERSMIEPRSFENPRFKELVKVIEDENMPDIYQINTD